MFVNTVIIPHLLERDFAGTHAKLVNTTHSVLVAKAVPDFVIDCVKLVNLEAPSSRSDRRLQEGRSPSEAACAQGSYGT